MNILRTSRTPLTAAEIAERLIAKCGMTKPTRAQRKEMATKVRNYLARQDGEIEIGERGLNAKVWRFA